MNNEELARMSDSEWKGYITRAIEGIDVDLKEIKEINLKQDENFSALKTRVATLGGTIALIVSLAVAGAGALVKGLFGR